MAAMTSSATLYMSLLRVVGGSEPALALIENLMTRKKKFEMFHEFSKFSKIKLS